MSSEPLQIKHAVLAAVLSFFFTGLGQIYNGQIGKGILLAALQVVSVILCAFLVGFVTTPLLWIYGIYDAYKVAGKLNQGAAAA